jgi:hypothetical protein
MKIVSLILMLFLFTSISHAMLSNQVPSITTPDVQQDTPNSHQHQAPQTAPAPAQQHQQQWLNPQLLQYIPNNMGGIPIPGANTINSIVTMQEFYNTGKCTIL